MYLFSDALDHRLRYSKHSPLLGYGVPVLSVALALLLTMQVPAIRSGTPFLFFFLAVTVSTWYGGVRAGLLAICLAALGAAYWVLSPAHSFQLTVWQRIQLAGFLTVAGAIMGLIATLQRERTTATTQHEVLRLTLASIGDAVIVTDAHGTVRWINQVAATLTGWGILEAEGRPLVEVFPIINEHTRTRVENPVSRVLIEGQVVGLANHTVLVGKDGVERPIEDSAAPIRDEFGAIYGVVLVFRDITERRRNETLRQAAEERFTRAFQASPDAFVISRETDGAILEVNDSWEKLFGYTRTEATGQTLLALQLYVNPEDRATIFHHFQSHGRVRDFELAVRTRSGEVRQASLALEAMRIHEEPCLLTILHDITERKQAEAALRTSEEKFAKAFNASPLVITITQLADGRLIEVNDSFVRLTGYTRQEVLGRTPIEIGLWVEPNQRAEGLAQLRAGRLPRNGEFRFRMKDGSERTCLMSAELLKLNGQTCVLTVLNDITERKQAEVARQVAEERFAKAFRASPQAMCINRVADGRYVDVNESFARLVDYPYADIIGRTSFDVGIWTDPQMRAATNQRIIEQGSNRDFEHRFRTRTGEWRDIVAAGVAIEVNGEPCILSLMNDVTERKRAEAALRESEARFRATFEQAAVGVAQVSPEGRYLSVNQRLCDITGYSQAALLQKTYQEITHPADLAANMAQADRLLKGEVTSYTLEKRYLHPNGSVLWVNLTESVVRDEQGLVKYRVAVMEDISARKAAEARLVFLAETSAVLASSLDYAATLQRVAELMVPQLADLCTVELVGPDRTIRSVAVAHVNPAKLTAVQLLRDLYPPRFDELHGIGEVLQTGRAAFYPVIVTERLLAVAPDATYRTLLQQIGFKSTLIVPLQVRGQTLGALTLAWSESERRYTEVDLQLAEEVAKRAALAVDNARLYQAARQAESELRQLNTSLEQHVATRTIELQRSNRELDQFAYVASHDLKAPLRAIDHLASWISQDGAAVLPAASQTHLAKLRGRVQRMDKLLNDLLDYSRAGRHHHPLEQVDTGELVRNVIDLLVPPAGFTVHLAEPFPVLVTERVPLETVLRNLIGNALKHHDRPQTGQVTVSAKEQERVVEFTVTDDGPGIDPQFHERIFQMFQTLKPRDQVEGSGMGLAVVKKLVESYGGAIQVESSVGRGATFRFTWPKAPVA